MTNFEKTININIRNLTEMKRRIFDTNKIAKRLGLEEITFDVSEVAGRSHLNSHERYVVVTITGEYPSFDGWTFVALLDHADNLVRSFGETNHRHLLGDTTCDHCNSNRQRNKTYVITNGEKSIRVGGACLSYYLPTKSINTLGTFYEAFDLIDNGYCDMGGGVAQSDFILKDVLMFSWMSIHTRGYTPVSEINSTKSRVETFLNPPMGESGESIIKHKNDLIEMYYDIAMEKVEEIIQWAKELTPKSDYEHNVKSSITNPTVNQKSLGYVVSSVLKFVKDIESVEKEKAKEKEPVVVSDYIGTIKKRELFTLTLKKVYVMDGYYGNTYLHNFVDLDGNSVVWFATIQLVDIDGELVKEDTTIDVKATVRKHQLYNNVKQTTISRVTSKV